MIKTDALKSIEGLFQEWENDALKLSIYIKENYPYPKRQKHSKSKFDVEKWNDLDKILNILFVFNTEDSPIILGVSSGLQKYSCIIQEAKENLLNFSQPGIEYSYFSRIDALSSNLSRATLELRENRTKWTTLEVVDKTAIDVLSRGSVPFVMALHGVSDVSQTSLVVSQNLEKFQHIRPDKKNLTLLTSQSKRDTDEVSTTLSAPQRLLFIRLLQQSALFPKKTNNTDDAPELRAIALLTGLDFKNDIKGAKGANAKVNQLLDVHKSLSTQQIPQKIADLNVIENIAKLLNVEPVISAIHTIRADLEKRRGS